MNLALWIAAALLALAFLATGLLKITQSKEKLAAAGMGWTESFSPSTITAIGVAEVLGAIGLILPAVLDVAPVLVPVAAVGLALVMVGAAVTHLRRKETQMVVVNVVLLALAVFVAWGRFGAYAF
ncbi:DoxX family protein [Cellulomonas sp. Leaf334]|uniref:DoxX family protein n=1 Tax=Cellulomonas sp. Leaf334 TaxID=1736339 RepID=UPI0006FC7F18|nr:DoxX family protein [Cellulomonas sp. Leaf334]KQR17560.1 hypothetical protein ASF78_09860 [Cellulomonas sp. Leaf334]